MNWPSVDLALEQRMKCPRATYLLGIGPWAWPLASSSLFPSACELTSRQEAPLPAVGTALLVTLDRNAAGQGSTGTLWRINARPAPRQAQLTELEASARDAHDRARAALLPALPVLWGAVRKEHLPQCEIEWLETVDLTTGVSRKPLPIPPITGPSLAAATALALASHLLEVPVDTHVVVSADLDLEGRLIAVEGVAEKAALVQRLVPGARFITAASDPNVGQPPPALPTTVETANSLKVLVGRAFPDVHALVKARLKTRGPQNLLREMEHNILVKQDCGLGWAPFRDACATAAGLLSSEEAGGPESQSATLLGWLGRIADRHLGGRQPLGDTPWAALESLPMDRLLHYYAHLAQHSADTGDPAPSALEPCDKLLLATPRTAWLQDHRRIAGALSRARAVTGPLADEMRAQRLLAEETWDAGCLDQLSFPLSAWLRLAGACNDVESFGAALRFRQETGALHSPDGTRFLDLAQGLSAALLERPDDIPNTVFRPQHGKTQLKAGELRLVLMSAMAGIPNLDPALCFAALIDNHKALLDRADAPRLDLRVSLRNILLAILDHIACGVELPRFADVTAGVVQAYVQAEQGTPGPGSDAATATRWIERPPSVAEVLDLFLVVEAEPMRRVRAVEEKAGHGSDREFADALRRRYPY